MSDIKAVLKDMVVRLARREIKSKVGPLERKIKELKKSAKLMQKMLDRQHKETLVIAKRVIPSEKISSLPSEIIQKSRLSPKLILKLRKKKKLTRLEFAKVLGVSSHTVYLWENGKSEPKSALKSKIISLRDVGRREISKILKPG